MKKNLEYWHDPDMPDNIKTKFEYFIPKILPSKSSFPKWFKDIPKYYDGSDKLKTIGIESNIGIKGCYPFIDTLTSGYMITLHCDVIIQKENDTTYINWTHEVNPVASRPESLIKDIPFFNGHTPYEFAWELYYRMQVPKGYSLLLTHPLNRTDLPFVSSSGIVDADSGVANGSIPFSLSKNFEGIIPAGTPIVQIIPFKRDEWKSSYLNKAKNIKWNPRKNIYGWYKKNIWKKKIYE